MMSDNADIVAHYINELRSGDAVNAFHSLIEEGAQIVPSIVAAFRKEENPDIRAMLVEVIQQFRTPDSVPFLAEALADPQPQVWKAALDALVTISCPEAIHTLENALSSADQRSDAADYIDWVKEALDQATHQSK
jgi:HEAT repeat protein